MRDAAAGTVIAIVDSASPVKGAPRRQNQTFAPAALMKVVVVQPFSSRIACETSRSKQIGDLVLRLPTR